jgi:hypothetical protein
MRRWHVDLAIGEKQARSTGNALTQRESRSRLALPSSSEKGALHYLRITRSAELAPAAITRWYLRASRADRIGGVFRFLLITPGTRQQEAP